MSFNDFASASNQNRPAARTSPAPTRGSVTAGNSIDVLARTLQDYQQNLANFVQKVGEYKKKKGGVPPADKRTCETQLNDFRSQEGRILNSYNNLKDELTKATATLSGGAVPMSIKDQKAKAAAAAADASNSNTVSSSGPKFNMPTLPNAPSLPGSQMTTAEMATRRLALSKIGNDINRMTAQLKSVSGEVNMLAVTAYGSSGGVANNSNSGMGNGGQQHQQQQQQQLQFQTLQGQDVDEMIMEERERDITKINSDIVLVNEMFKDMANIVQAQQPQIDEVHKSTTDVSNLWVWFVLLWFYSVNV